MTLRKLHRWNALMLALFLTLHMGNHVLILAGIETHLEVMKVLRLGYRLPGLEHILIALFFAQMGLGIALMVKRGRPNGRWAWAQALSGGYLAFFLVQHIPATLLTRFQYPDMGTDSYWAASVVSAPPYVFYFAPYYILAILALFTHIACALHFRNHARPATVIQRGLPIMGGVLGVAIILGFMGVFHPFDLPAANQTYLDEYLGLMP